MLRAAFALLAWVLLSAQTPMLPGFPPGTFQSRAALDAAPAGGVSLSLDGSVHSTTASFVGTVTLSTSKTNNIIYVSQRGNAAPVSVVGSTLGAFTARGGSGLAGGYWALATSILTNEIITVTQGGGGTFLAITAFAVNGAKTSAPFDVNASIPTATSFGAPQDPFSITTSAANTMLIGIYDTNATASPTAGSGWTGIQLNGDSMLAEYQIVSSAGSYSITIGTGVGTGRVGFGDAIVQGP